MNKILILLSAIILLSCGRTGIKTSSNTSNTEIVDTYNPKDFYNKKEIAIPMRDGIKLHTTIYFPKDTSKKYPILMSRTPYSCRPYGSNEYKALLSPNRKMMKEGNIIVYQDVRGRWNSEGVYDNMRAYIPNKKEGEVDEASDTYDTIESVSYTHLPSPRD